jgi:hypothetical protein
MVRERTRFKIDRRRSFSWYAESERDNHTTTSSRGKDGLRTPGFPLSTCPEASKQYTHDLRTE